MQNDTQLQYDEAVRRQHRAQWDRTILGIAVF